MAGKQGFASMNKDRQREIASMGGKTAHAMGTAHQFTSEEAREAGKKGGRTGGRYQFNSETGRAAGLKRGLAKKGAA